MIITAGPLINGSVQRLLLMYICPHDVQIPLLLIKDGVV